MNKLHVCTIIVTKRRFSSNPTTPLFIHAPFLAPRSPTGPFLSTVADVSVNVKTNPSAVNRSELWQSEVKQTANALLPVRADTRVLPSRLALARDHASVAWVSRAVDVVSAGDTSSAVLQEVPHSKAVGCDTGHVGSVVDLHQLALGSELED